MKNPIPQHLRHRGVSLVETMVAIGVLAVVAPLALAAMLKAGEGGSLAKVETRAPAMVETCLIEIQNARSTGSQYLQPLIAGEPFGKETPICIAFRSDGTVLGPISAADYESGAEKLGTEYVTFLARVQGELDTSRLGFPEMLDVTITIEHPASVPAEKRRKLDYLTKLP